MWAYASGTVTAVFAALRHGGTAHTSVQMPDFFPIGPRLAMHPRLSRLISMLPHVLNANTPTHTQPQTQPGQQQQQQPQPQQQVRSPQAAGQPASPPSALTVCRWALQWACRLSGARRLRFGLLIVAQFMDPTLHTLTSAHHHGAFALVLWAAVAAATAMSFPPDASMNGGAYKSLESQTFIGERLPGSQAYHVVHRPLKCACMSIRKASRSSVKESLLISKQHSAVCTPSAQVSC